MRAGGDSSGHPALGLAVPLHELTDFPLLKGWKEKELDGDGDGEDMPL